MEQQVRQQYTHGTTSTTTIDTWNNKYDNNTHMEQQVQQYTHRTTSTTTTDTWNNKY
jgi:hypothetical protein